MKYFSLAVFSVIAVLQAKNIDLNGDGNPEQFQYNPKTTEAIVTNYDISKNSFDVKYQSLGWGVDWKVYFGDLDGDEHDEIFRYNSETGEVIVTEFSTDLTSISNPYKGVNWGKGWEIYIANLNGGEAFEVFRYNPTTSEGIVSSFSKDLKSCTTHYNGLGWGYDTEIHISDLDGDERNEIFRYSPQNGNIILTLISSDLESFVNVYKGYNWDENLKINFANLNGGKSSEVIRYDPLTSQLTVSSFDEDLMSCKDYYSGMGWGYNTEMLVANLDGKEGDELFRYNPINGDVIVTAFNEDLLLFNNVYKGYNWGVNRINRVSNFDGNGQDEIYRPHKNSTYITHFPTYAGVSNIKAPSFDYSNIKVPTNDINGQPIGGGNEYDFSISVSDANVTVTDFNELKSALSNAQVGDIIYVDADSLFLETDINIPSNVTLASDRGIDNSRGTLLVASQSRIYITGSNVRITGLSLKGPHLEVGDSTYETTCYDGIFAKKGSSNIEVDNCEIWGWSHAAIYLNNSKNAFIHNNYIHDNVRTGLGYGVSHNEAADSRIIGNLFYNNRHAIAGSGHPGQSYEASYNTVLPDNYPHKNHSFDMHGGLDRKDNTDIAGETIHIHHNTFLDINDYAVVIRGVPEDFCLIENNTFAQWPIAAIQANAYGQFELTNNRYNYGFDFYISK